MGRIVNAGALSGDRRRQAVGDERPRLLVLLKYFHGN